MGLEKAEIEVLIDHIHANTYHLAKKCENRSTEIIWLHLKKIKKKEINASKIYSPVDKFVKWAKRAKIMQSSLFCPYVEILQSCLKKARYTFDSACWMTRRTFGFYKIQQYVANKRFSKQ